MNTHAKRDRYGGGTNTPTAQDISYLEAALQNADYTNENGAALLSDFQTATPTVQANIYNNWIQVARHDSAQAYQFLTLEAGSLNPANSNAAGYQSELSDWIASQGSKGKEMAKQYQGLTPACQLALAQQWTSGSDAFDPNTFAQQLSQMSSQASCTQGPSPTHDIVLGVIALAVVVGGYYILASKPGGTISS